MYRYGWDICMNYKHSKHTCIHSPSDLRRAIALAHLNAPKCNLRSVVNSAPGFKQKHQHKSLNPPTAGPVHIRSGATASFDR